MRELIPWLTDTVWNLRPKTKSQIGRAPVCICRLSWSTPPAPVVAVDLMRHAVHVDARTYSLADRHSMEFAAEDDEPGFKLIQAVDVGLDPYSVDLDAVISWADAVRLDRVQL